MERRRKDLPDQGCVLGWEDGAGGGWGFCRREVVVFFKRPNKLVKFLIGDLVVWRIVVYISG